MNWNNLSKELDMNLKKNEERKEETTHKIEFFKPMVGKTILYLHPSIENDENEFTYGLNYIPVVRHYINKSVSVCLNSEINPILEHPIIKKSINFVENMECVGCETKENHTQTDFLFGVTPIKYMESDTWKQLNPKPTIYIANNNRYSEIINIFFESYCDITNKDETTYIELIKTKNGYQTIRVNLETAMNPVKLSSEFFETVSNSMKTGGSSNLFDAVIMMIKRKMI